MAKKYDKEQLLAEWKAGGYSQRQLAKKYDISPSMVAKLTKGIDKESVQLVSEIAQVKQQLSEKTEKEVSAISEQVNRIISFENRLNVFSEKAMIKADDLLSKAENGQDFKAIIDGVDKHSVTIGFNQRHANSQVNIQNTNAQQNNMPSKIEIVAQPLDDSAS